MIKALLFVMATLAMTLPAMAHKFDGGVLVRTITKGGVNIKYYRKNEVGAQSTVYVCLTNMTATTKSMVWTRLTPPWSHALDLVAAPRTRECTVFPHYNRIEWNFVDGKTVRTREAMSLGGFKGDVVNFEWRSTRAELVRSCQEQHCDRLVGVGVDHASDLEISSQYGIATFFCFAFCEARY